MSDGKTDLKSMLAEVVDASEAEPVPITEVKQAEIPATAAEAAPKPDAKPAAEPTETRERGPDGKFLPREAKETPPSTEMPNAAAKPADEGEEKPTETPALTADVPAHWSAADKQMIEKLPAEFKGEVVERIKRMEAGFTPKLQKLAQMEKEYGEAVEIFAPHMDAIRQRGQTPSDVVKIWAQVEQGLIGARMAAQSGRTDPQALNATDGGAQIIARMIQNYNIDPGVVAQHLQGAAQQRQAAPNGQNGAQQYTIPPELMQVVNELKQRVDTRDQFDVTQRVGQAQNQIEQFANEKNADGSLKHPFFSSLEDDITQLAAIERSQGRPIDLPALYDKAAWANSSTRDQLLTSQRQAEAKRAADEQKAKAEAARKASSSITGAPTPGQMPQGAPTNRKLRDSIVSALEEAQ